MLPILEINMGGHQRITQPTTKPTPRKNFTMKQSSKELTFLDILIKNVNGQIITDIYHKPTDTQQSLRFKSRHPKSCVKSIPHTLARKIQTIITDKKIKKLTLKNYT